MNFNYSLVVVFCDLALVIKWIVGEGGQDAAVLSKRKRELGA